MPPEPWYEAGYEGSWACTVDCGLPLRGDERVDPEEDEVGEMGPCMLARLLAGLGGGKGEKRYVMDKKTSPRRAAELSMLHTRSWVITHLLRSSGVVNGGASSA